MAASNQEGGPLTAAATADPSAATAATSEQPSEPYLDRHLSLDAASTGTSSSSQFNDEDDTSAIIGEQDGASNADGASSSANGRIDPNADRTTSLQTYLHILKGNVGPGCLSLPWAVTVLGIPLALLTLLVLGVMTSFNCWSVVRWKRRHAADRRDVTYADLGELAYGRRFRAFVMFCVCATQLCVCTVFFSFIGENVSAVLRAVAPGTVLDDNRVVISLVLPMAMLLSCAPNLRVLAPATALGMVLLFLGFGCIGGIIGRNWADRPEELPAVDSARIPLAMCAFLYSFEGINLVIPIEAAMMEPARFDMLFALGMATMTAIYAAFACLCVVTFGSIDNGSVTAFLMEHQDEFSAKTLVLAANFIVSVSVLVTYPLQLFPAINLVSQMRDRRAHLHPPSHPIPQSSNSDDEGDAVVDHETSTASFMPLDGEPDRLEDELGTESSHFTKRGGLFQNRTTFEGDSPMLRATLVMSTYLVAILIPNVQELISLSGAFAGSSAALIIPPLLELRSILENNHRFSLVAVSRYVLLAIGVVFLLVGTAASILDIIKAFQEGDGGNR